MAIDDDADLLQKLGRILETQSLGGYSTNNEGSEYNDTDDESQQSYNIDEVS
jgi:hypothetical protein